MYDHDVSPRGRGWAAGLLVSALFACDPVEEIDALADDHDIAIIVDQRILSAATATARCATPALEVIIQPPVSVPVRTSIHANQ